MGLFQLPWLPERTSARVPERTLRASGLNAGEARRLAARYADPRALTGPMNWYRGLPLSQLPTDPVVRVPTTFVWGRRDPYLGRAAAEKTVDFVAADYAFIELDAAHWLPQEQPEAVAAAVVARVSRAG